MSDTYLVLLTGAFAGLVAAFLGGIILHRTRLRTHLSLRERIEAERTALQTEISEIDQEELGQTDAGKALMRFSQASIQKFGYAREDPMISLRKHNLELLKQIDEYKKRSAQSEERMVAMSSLLQESQKAIESLRKDNEKLRLTNSFKERVNSTNSVQVEQNLRLTLEEVARLQNQLAETNMRLIEVEMEGIAPFSGELHQTLSANLQNIDLLLGESIGTLNAMQHNQLEGIKGSLTRLHNVIADFIQLLRHEGKAREPARESVELKPVIEEAVRETRSQMRAKRITLNVDLRENLSTAYIKHDALGQILTRLLSNAGAVSPLQGTVQLLVHRKTHDSKEYLLIQVSDTGGGIPAEDLARVFTPLYRETDIPARGVGETGMGLFIVKTLTEAQNGKIWVETDLGVGSTYNVLIPIAGETQVNMNESK